MKSLFGRCLLCLVLAGFLPACTSVFTDAATEQEFRKVSSGLCDRSGISTACAEYQIEGLGGYSSLHVTAKRDNQLNLRYSGRKAAPFELRMDKGKGAVFRAESKQFETLANGTAATVFLGAYQKFLWYGPEGVAERISLVKPAAENRHDAGSLHDLQFELVPKKEFAPCVKNVRIFTDAETHNILRITYDLTVEETVQSVSADFMKCAWSPGKDLFPAKVSISFRHSKINLVLKSSDQNKPVSDDLFRLSEDEHNPVKNSDHLK